MNSPGDAEPILFRTEGLAKLYPDGQVWALREVSIEIRRGEYVAVMGPSGSGKSTLLNVLGGLDRPSQGEVYFDGEPLGGMRSLDRYRCDKVGFVFQSFHLLPVLTALENVQVPMFETSRPAQPTGPSAPENFSTWWGWDTAGTTFRSSFRWGNGRRVAIARALANEPVALLADEPTGNLDTANSAQHPCRFRRPALPSAV